VDIERVATEAISPQRHPRAVSAVVWNEHATLEAQCGSIAYWSSGSGPPVVLVHGWEAAHSDFDAFVAPLLAKGLRVVAIDLPAHGSSTGEVASITDCGNALLAAGARFGPLAGVVGHSAGCAAISYALLDGLDVERAVLVSTPERYERYVRWFAKENDVDGDALIALMETRGVAVTSYVLPDNAVQFDVPALIVHSIDDRTCDIRGARNLAKAWRGSELFEVDGLGHMRILRDAGVVERIVSFVAEGATL
jgi:pimeloyl-ACP methyl ester carboxylesterase